MGAASYQRIKAHVLGRIADGTWREGDRIPSEPELARSFKVARMTVNRAVCELAAEHALTRLRGSGTFVAPPRQESTVVALRSIDKEIHDRGGVHQAEVLALEAVRASPSVAIELGLRRGARVFHSRLIHREDGRPVQLEERWVTPAVAPDYLAQDFTRLTPSDYLVRVAPVARVEYRIEARSAPRGFKRALELVDGEPCLLLRRRSFSGGGVAAITELWHPGLRYRLTGQF